MSRYRRVLTRIWEDDKFPFLSLEARFLFLYHLTSPRSTPFLLYVEGPGAIADAVKLPSRRYSSSNLADAMRELSGRGLAWYAADGSNLICLPKALLIRENAPESPNAVTAWVNLFLDLPKTSFKNRCVSHWLSLREGITHGMTHAFLDALAKAYPMTSAIQEQEQEQEQEQDKKSPPMNPPQGGTELTRAEDVIKFLNQKTGRSYRCRDGRGKPTSILLLVASRLRTGATVENCRGVVARKVRQWWGDEKMRKYLRPATLFGKEKFEEYLGERPNPDWVALGTHCRECGAKLGGEIACQECGCAEVVSQGKIPGEG